jgi:predicted DNA-binding protein (MmcQ/YjbR family)
LIQEVPALRLPRGWRRGNRRFGDGGRSYFGGLIGGQGFVYTITEQTPERAADPKVNDARGRSMSASRTKTGPRKKTAAKRSATKKSATKKSATKKSAASDDATFQKVRELCLALPDTKLTMTWGSPHFRVGEKIFCGFGVEEGKPVMGVKLEMAHARRVVEESRFWPAAYVGKHGWVSMDVSQRKSWDEVGALIRESYGLIAPKSSRAKLR